MSELRMVALVALCIYVALLLSVTVAHIARLIGRRQLERKERIFVELRQMGYQIADVNSNCSRALLNYMDPITEESVYAWVDIVELGEGYGLSDPINYEQN